MGNFQIQPPQASEFAPKHDALFWAITALTVFFTVVTFAIVVFLAIKYRDTNHNVNRDNPQHESLKLELGWSLPPLLLGIGIFVWSTTLFIHERIPQKNASEIFVIGKQWMWHIQHSNGVRETNELHVPVGRPIKLTMISQDVIHAFIFPPSVRSTTLCRAAIRRNTLHLR